MFGGEMLQKRKFSQVYVPDWQKEEDERGFPEMRFDQNKVRFMKDLRAQPVGTFFMQKNNSFLKNGFRNYGGDAKGIRLN